MNTFTAQELSDFYQKVADGGEIQTKFTDSTWESITNGPSITSSKSLWRIKPTKKVIDLSVLIDSQIDCEFKPNGGQWYVGKLKEILASGLYEDRLSNIWEQCQPRMNHIHAWQGGECPLPEGFRVKVWYRNDKEGDAGDAFNLRWSNKQGEWESDIIAFEVLGVADGYVMPWEQDNE